MDANDTNVYRYTKGDKYSCVVCINADGHVVYGEVKYPLATTDEVIDKLMDDAERWALLMYDKKVKERWQ